MPDDSHPENWGMAAESSAMILQIDRPGAEGGLKFPAMIRNLAGGVVTLEINNPWTIMNWETLKGLKGCLRLQSSGTGEPTEIRGTVTRARYTVQDQDSGQLDLDLKLTGPDQSVQELLFEHITQTSDDIKGLWNRWEQTRQTPDPASLSQKTGFTALALLLGGVALQVVGPHTFKLFGWVLWLFGTLMVAGQTLRFWKSRKASR